MQVVLSHLAQKGYSLAAGDDEDKGFSPFHVFRRRLESEFNAVKGGHRVFVLAIGYPASYDAANLGLYEAFFRLAALDAQHMNGSIIIAVPSEFKNSFTVQKQNRPSARCRKGRWVPDIGVYFVDVKNRTVEEDSWYKDN